MTTRSNSNADSVRCVEEIVEEPRWRRRPEKRPGEILDAALSILYERGYSGCRMEDIARRAGVSKGTVYVYFPTKVDLVQALVARGPEELTSRLGQLTVIGPVLHRLREVVEIIWMVISKPQVGTVYGVLTSGRQELSETAALYVRELTRCSITAVSELVAESVAQGVFRPVNVLEASRMILALIFQHVSWNRDREAWPVVGLTDPGEIVDKVEQFYRAALEVTSS